MLQDKTTPQMYLFGLMDRYPVLPTHTCINTPHMMKDRNKEMQKRGWIRLERVGDENEKILNVCNYNSLIFFSKDSLVDIQID